jgi:hypothetical protein
MCDPVSLAIASTVATGVGAVGSLASSAQARSAQKRQQQEVQAWQREQKRARDTESLRQESLRQEAEATRQVGVGKLSAEEQKKAQEAEAARLETELTGQGMTAAPEAVAPISASDVAIAKESAGQNYKSDLAAAINSATKGARQRLGALADISAYGESFGGMGTRAKEALAASGADINMFNEFRRGSLGAFGVEQNIDPVQLSSGESPMADLFSTALQVGAQGLGKYYGTPGAASRAATGIGGRWGQTVLDPAVGAMTGIGSRFKQTRLF